MMTSKEISILLAHTCTELSDAAAGKVVVPVEESIENLIKYISLCWPKEAGFLYAGFDEARERHRREQTGGARRRIIHIAQDSNGTPEG